MFAYRNGLRAKIPSGRIEVESPTKEEQFLFALPVYAGQGDRAINMHQGGFR